MSIPRWPFPRLVPMCLVLLPVMSCGGGEAAVSTASVETLPNGAVRVSNTAEGEWAASGTQPWQLVEDLRIGRVEGDGPDVFGRIRNVFADSAGRIWAMDSQARALHLFDASGEFVRTIGRPGEGPGEVATNSCAYAGPAGEIWIEGGGRWQRFDTTGVLLGSIPMTRNCARSLWTTDERFLLYVSGGSFVEHRLNTAGELVAGDTVPAPSFPDPPIVTWRRAGGGVTLRSALPFWPTGSFVQTGSGDLWISDGGGPYAFRHESLAGDTLMLVERAYDPVPVDDTTWQAATRREGFVADEPYDVDRIPRVYPPFDRLQPAADGSIWIFRTVEGGATSLDVFASDGRYLGAPVLPADFDRMRIHAITGDHIYAVAADELDVQYVVRLRIAKP